MFGENINLDVHLVAGASHTERGDIRRVGDDRHLKRVVVERKHCEADAVNRDGTLLDQQVHLIATDTNAKIGGWRHDFSDEVYMAEHDVTAETAVRSHWSLKIYTVADCERTERRATKRLVADVRFPPTFAGLYDGEATAVHCDGSAD